MKKPIQGYCTLELIDAKTGRVTQRSEHHNLITNAIDEWYKAGGMSNPSAFGAQAIRESAIHYLLGGVMLLDTAIPENANTIKVPSGVGMTANGVIGVTNGGNPPELGSYNDLESGWQADGSFKMVWDWTTSQGNGTVATVCLSSRFGAYKGIGNKSLTNKEIDVHMGIYNGLYQFNNANIQYPSVYLGQYDNKVFYIQNNGVNGGHATASEWSVVIASSPYAQLDLRNGLTRRQLEIRTVTHPVDIHEYGNGTYRAVQIGKYSYLMVAYAHTSGSYYTRHFHFDNTYPVVIYKIDLETLTVVDSITLSPQTTGVPAFELSGGVYPTISCNGKWAVYHNVIFNLSNLTDTTEITNFTEDTGLQFIADDIAESSSRRLDVTLGEMLPTNYTNGTNYTPTAVDGIFGIGDTYVFRDPRYIASIWQPEAPYTKDASKMMKCTYVIRFSEE